MLAGWIVGVVTGQLDPGKIKELGQAPWLGFPHLTAPEIHPSIVLLVLYGLIGLVGVRIWLDARVDLTDPVNLFVAAAALVAGIGNLTLTVGGARLGGIAWGSIIIVVLYPLLRRLRPCTDAAPAPKRQR